MSCICCDENKLNVGCVDPCQPLTISYISPAILTYILRLEFDGVVIDIEAEVAGGDPLVFDISGLNESYIYTAVVLDASGNKLTFTDVGAVKYDCFIIQTKIGVTTKSTTPPLTI